MAFNAAPQSHAQPIEEQEQGANETARMLRTLIANIDGMVYRALVDSNWTLEFVSDGCLALTGYDPEELLYNNKVSFENLTHPDDRQRVRHAAQAALAQGARFEAEYRI